MQNRVIMTEKVKQEQDIVPDLRPFAIEGKLNSWHYKKGWKRRFIVREDRGAVEVVLRDYVIAIYLVEQNKLFRLASCLDLHWQFVKKVFKGEYGEIKIVE